MSDFDWAAAERAMESDGRLQQAIDQGSEALRRIDRHEADCVEFRREIKTALDRLWGRWWSAAVGVVALLLGIIAWLLVHPIVLVPAKP